MKKVLFTFRWSRASKGKLALRLFFRRRSVTTLDSTKKSFGVHKLMGFVTKALSSLEKTTVGKRRVSWAVLAKQAVIFLENIMHCVGSSFSFFGFV